MKLTPMETAAVLSSKLKQNCGSGVNKRPPARNSVLNRPSTLSQQLQSAKIVENGQRGGVVGSSTNPAMMKRLLSHAGMRIPIGDNSKQMKRSGSYRGPPHPPIGSVPIQIMSRHQHSIQAGRHGFPKQSPKGSQIVAGAATIESAQLSTPTQKQLTQAQIYNRMQQAKLLGNHSDKFSAQMPPIIKSKPTLANLLRYQSPRQARHESAPILLPTQQSSKQLGPVRRHNQAELPSQIALQKNMQIMEQVESPTSGKQLQVRVDQSTQIFRDMNRSGISPIQSEGSQYSHETSDRKNRQQQLLDRRLVPVSPQHAGSIDCDARGAYEQYHVQYARTTPTRGDESGNANILIKDCAVAQIARRQEPYLGMINKQSPTGTPNRRVGQVPAPVEKEKLRHMHINGAHINTQEIFFDTQQDDETGRTLITVPPLPSKFGAIVKAGGKETKKTYAICKIDDRELERAMSDATKSEIRQLKKMAKEKCEVKQDVFFEDIYTFPIELNAKADRETRKRKNLDIGKKLQDEREQQKWDKLEQKLVQSRNLAGPADADRNLSAEGFVQDDENGGGGGLGGSHFNYMNIDELKQHEHGILNLFEGEKNIGRYNSHNNEAQTGLSGGHQGRKYVRLNQHEYDTIFEKDPSFNEKKAFVEVFRRKWREDKGYCSMFDKRQKFRKAKSAVFQNDERKEMAQKLHKNRQEHLMLVNYREKKAQKEIERAQKQFKAELEIEESRERRSRSHQRLARRALKRTRTKTPTKRQLPIAEDDERKLSQLFPLSKTASLEFIMQGIASSKVKLVAGSIRRSVSSPRAWSAHALGARNRSGNLKPSQVRIESSHAPLARDQSKPRADATVSTKGVADAGSDEPAAEIQLQGKQAQMHQPLQNHDNDYLSNFITQMYQNTTVQYQGSSKPQLKQIDVQDQRVDYLRNSLGSQELEVAGPPGKEVPNVGCETPNDDDERYQHHPDEAISKTGTIKGNVGVRDIPLDQSGGRYTYTMGLEEPFQTSKQAKTKNGASAALYEKDIKIVTMVSKERVSEAQQFSKRDFQIIQKALDKNVANTAPSRDPKSAKTLPVTQRHTLIRQDEAVEYARKGQKTLYSHRDEPLDLRDKTNSMTVGAGSKKIAARLSQQITKNAKPGHVQLMINNQKTHGVEVGESKEMRPMSSEGTIADPGNGHQLDAANQSYYQNLAQPATTAVLFQNNNEQDQALKNRQSQQTDSKSSKLSDDVHDGSFMQPKNARDSFDFKGADAAGHISYIPVDSGITGEKITISSKDRSKQTQRQQKSFIVGEATVSSIRAREITKLKHPAQKNDYSAASKQQMAYGRLVSTAQPELTSFGSKDGDGGVSRQQRVTVNSSYKSKKANQLENQRKEIFFAQASSLLDAVPTHGLQDSSARHLAADESPGSIGANILNQPTYIDSPLRNQPDQNIEATASNQDLQYPQQHQLNDEDEWKMHGALLMVDDADRAESQSQLDVLMKQGRPSVYNLPHNPINQKSFKCNYIKSRVEATRRDFIQSQTQNAFQLGNAINTQSSMGARQTIPLENAAYANTVITNAQSNMPLTAFDTTASQLALVNSAANVRATSASSFKNPVSNAYLRNHKLVQQRKKEQQFCYYLQQHRQNKQLLESLEKQAADQNVNRTLMMASSANQLGVANDPRMQKNVRTRARSNNKREKGKAFGQTPMSNSTVRTPANLIIAGQGAFAFNSGGVNIATKNQDINGSGVDPKLLETNSPLNRKIIEEAYMQYAGRHNSQGGSNSNALDTVEQLKGSSNY